MKLYVYDSCPFCTRVRTFIGLKDIVCEIEFLQAGEYPDHLEGRISKKVVPILEIENSVPNKSVLMQESLAIIEFLDKLFGTQLIRDFDVSSDINMILGDIAKTSSKLCYPRMLNLELAELKSDAAKEFFKRSREERMGCSFTDALLNTDEIAIEVFEHLIVLDSKLMFEELLLTQRGININDIAIFAELRNLSMVHELQLPEQMKAFAEYISNQAGVPLFNPISKLRQTRGYENG